MKCSLPGEMIKVGEILVGVIEINNALIMSLKLIL